MHMYIDLTIVRVDVICRGKKCSNVLVKASLKNKTKTLKPLLLQKKKKEEILFNLGQMF